MLNLNIGLTGLHMFSEYIEAALGRAVYKTIEDENPIIQYSSPYLSFLPHGPQVRPLKKPVRS